MRIPAGHWHIVANGFQGDLDIVLAPNGSLGGTIRIDLPTVDPIVGSWNEAEQKIQFHRDVIVAGGSQQNYTGFMFEADGSLFGEGAYGPPVEPEFRVLAGSFEGTATSMTRPCYGWIAWQHI